MRTPAHARSSTHGHAHDAEAPAGLRGRRLVVGAAVAVVLAVLLGLVLLRPDAGAADRSRVAQGERTSGTVTATAATPCSTTPDDSPTGTTCLAVTLRLDDGPDAGRTLTTVTGAGVLRGLAPGRGVVLLGAGTDVPFQDRYQLVDRERGRPLLLLAVLFVVAVVLVGRLRGLLALAGLGASLLLLGLFLVPALLSGRPPVLTAVVGAGAVLCVVLPLAHGLSLRAATALLGTALGLLVTVGVAGLFVELAALTGLSSDEVASVQAGFPDLDVRGLLLAGIVVGSLGVLDDVTVTQVSAVWELRRADPAQSRRSLYAAAMRVGRDHIAATTNTLLLAYAGAALPVLVLFSTSGDTLVQGVTSGVVAEEVVRTLAGSLGLLSAVPLTTALAAWCCPAEQG